MNTALDEGQFQDEIRWDAARVLEVFDAVFDVLKPAEDVAEPDGQRSGARNAALNDIEIEAQIEERNRAKKARDFARADAIRAALQERGVVLEDTKDGVRWKRK
jgi:cysteinyl-tRNA synthetase